MLAAVVAAKKRREKRTHQKQKLPPNQGNIADSPLPSLKTLVSPRFPPDPPLTRSEYFSWDHVDVQYAAEMSQSKIQVMKDKRSRHALCKLAQADRWNREVLPSLIHPYMKVARGCFSDLLAEEPHSPARLEEVVLTVCPCRLAAIQLVERSFFPCAPLFPTLAVSLDMLEFVASLFLHTAPNERAWAMTLVEYLKAHGYEFATGDSFQRCFANALDDKRGLISELDERTPVHEQGYVNVQSDPKLSANSTPTNASVNAPATILTHVSADLPPDICSNFIPADHTHPSEYLRSQCPLCFGGNHTDTHNMLVQLIGETGACDPPVTSPKTIVLSRDYLESWERKILETRPVRPACMGPKCTANEGTDYHADHPEDDTVEPGLHAPNSTYDACWQSFIAADEDRVKVSTQYFEDTGVIALLCRHDIPLAVASMWTAGEKQFYVFALLETILKHVLSHWRIGALCDIGCQMDQTLKKWRFMLEWLPRLEWGVLIFHAYGHQWACQLWYHPHKSELWGLSDGEGCEQFWSELHRLIPGLWVTGYHWCLFILDLQVEHIDDRKRMGMGKWLQGQIDWLQHCLEEAEMKLGDCSPSYLMEQFKAQREYHSQPVSHQSQTKGAQAVEQIISLTATLEAQRGNLKDLIAEGNDLVQDDMTASNEVQAEWQEKVRLLKEAIWQLETTINKKTDELWLTDHASASELNRLKKDKWVNIQLNLCALHEQLLKKLRARKFELATLDCTNSSCILDQKTKAHVEKAVKNRSGGIEATVKKYNARLKELVVLRGRGGIWRDAYIPPMLTMDGLYKLDVDQDIWEDSRGNIADFPDGVVPPWLADPSVKEGIQISQEVASCQQELERCKGEHANLQMWFHEEYSAAMDLFMGSKDEDVSYFGLLWAHQLYDWMTAWKKDIVQVPIAPGAPSWDSVRMPLALHQHYVFDHNCQSRRNLDDFDASSDDDSEGGELEEFFELKEAGLIATVDQAIVELDLDSE
ncbi:hypothetical protein BS47DRAFT_1401906 [Hydnum rufescens UP504]|uniref:CxC1-like cysteine cluster associated with KDZ transposases domain-containing protein n=1 Tax=Hydnum rufescens UP504 TaxID=1448309 RepID=A0A9P6AE60_9AGAM|nr:hypothetical protein BS47DRAFT_1401906 [Hydnum rufescens UP504]